LLTAIPSKADTLGQGLAQVLLHHLQLAFGQADLVTACGGADDLTRILGRGAEADDTLDQTADRPH
jgi:hypothetical protein